MNHVPVRRPGCELGRRSFAAAALTGALLLVGCSRDSRSEAVGSPTASVDDGFKPSSTAGTLLAKAKQSTARATTVRVSGTLTSGASPMSIDVVVAGAAATGSLRLGGGTAEIRVVSAMVYLKGDAAFWDAFVPGTGKQFAGQWLRVSATTAPEFGAMLGLVPLNGALDRWTPDGAPLAEAPGRQVRGLSAVGLRHDVTPRGAELYVATAAPNYPVLVKLGGGGELAFGSWGGKPPQVAVPKGTVIDASRTSLKV